MLLQSIIQLMGVQTIAENVRSLLLKKGMLIKKKKTVIMFITLLTNNPDKTLLLLYFTENIFTSITILTFHM